MKHLMLVSIGMVVLGVAWMIYAWFFAADRIWIVPGAFLIITGIVKMGVVQIWTRIAKLGTDEHKPIKAL